VVKSEHAFFPRSAPSPPAGAAVIYITAPCWIWSTSLVTCIIESWNHVSSHFHTLRGTLPTCGTESSFLHANVARIRTSEWQ